MLVTEGFVFVSLQIMEHYWLGQTLFLASNEISIADLLYSCEIDQLRMLDGADQVGLNLDVIKYNMLNPSAV